MTHAYDELDATALSRTWWFMIGGIACFAWPLAMLASGPTGWWGAVRLLGIGAAHAAAPLSWGIALVVVVVFCGLSMRGYPLIRQHLLDVTSHPALKAVAMVFGTAAAIVEEVWFRRLPMDWAAGRGWGALTQVALAAILFALPHAVWGVAARSVRVLVGSVVATGLLGAALAVVYLTAGRVLAPCIWAHTAINGLLEPWLFLAAMTRGMQARTAGPIVAGVR